MRGSTYRVAMDSAATYTIIRTDEHGEEFNLNAGGAPILNRTVLRDFIETLYEEQAFGDDVRKALILDSLPDEFGKATLD